jgi:hypothetical protein
VGSKGQFVARAKNNVPVILVKVKKEKPEAYQKKKESLNKEKAAFASQPFYIHLTSWHHR